MGGALRQTPPARAWVGHGDGASPGPLTSGLVLVAWLSRCGQAGCWAVGGGPGSHPPVLALTPPSL